jgi:D-sedoheptulose 7-phosphate isomerase
VFTIGNGGSSSTASHLAADLSKNTTGPNMRRFRITSLNDNAAIVTALANDLGYEHVFSEQLVNLIRAGDVLIAVSASGNSPNIVNAIRYAQQQSAHVAALLGFDGGVAATLADNAIIVPSSDFGIVEDLHLAINHILVEHFRDYLAASARLGLLGTRATGFSGWCMHHPAEGRMRPSEQPILLGSGAAAGDRAVGAAAQ